MMKNDIDKIDGIDLLRKSRRNKRAKAIKNSKSQRTFSTPAAVRKLDPLSKRRNGRKRKADNRYGISLILQSKVDTEVVDCEQLLGARAELAPILFPFLLSSNNDESTLVRNEVMGGRIEAFLYFISAEQRYSN